MNYDPDDPRFTAYALGELEAAEHAEVEALMRDHADARRLVDELQSLAQLLSDQLKQEPAPALLPTQIEQIASRATTAKPVIATLPAWSRMLRYGIAAGALTFVAGSSYIIWQQNRPQERLNAARSERFDAAEIKARAVDREVADFDAEAAPPLNAPQAPAGAEAEILAVREPKLAFGELREGDMPDPSPALPAPARAVTSESLITANVSAPAPPVDPNLRHYYSAPPAPAGAALGLKDHNPASAPVSFSTQPAGEAARGLAAQMGRMAAPAKADDFSDFSTLARQSNEGAPAQNIDAARLPQLYDKLGEGFSQGLDEQKLGESKVTAEASTQVRLQLESEKTAELGKELNDRGGVVSNKEKRSETEGVDESQRNVRSESKLSAIDAWRFRTAGRLTASNTENYAAIAENAPTAVTPKNTLSTFAVDVDTAAYANMRRFLLQGNTLPPPDAIRLEELINYFSYDYPEPSGDAPFSVDTEVTRCPWNADHKLLRIGLKGRSVAFENRKPANLVFLVDASGSMDDPKKMPLVKAGLRMLVEQLGENDLISIVTYASGSGVALQPTTGHRKPEILAAIDAIHPGGSTNGAAGINTAYEIAKQNFIKDGINRVILATDGDFNVGVTDDGSLVRMAEEHAKSGVFLNAVGFGTDNLKDQKLEQIADKGNGQYHYIDSLMEARKNFVDQIGGTLVTIAKDVKIQLDFNPAKVGAYRQIGYENRAMAAQDFRDDAKDAGEIGSGHTVTALYELIPPSAEAQKLAGQVPESRYVRQGNVTEDAKSSNELATVFLRYKQPDGDKATEIQSAVKDEVKDLGKASTDTKFAASVALFGMQLRGSKHIPAESSLDATLEMAEANRGRDQGGYRAEFVELIKKAKAIVTPEKP